VKASLDTPPASETESNILKTARDKFFQPVAAEGIAKGETIRRGGIAPRSGSEGDSDHLLAQREEKGEETMNSVIKKLKRLLCEAPFTSRISGSALALLPIAVLLFGATGANAACGLTGAVSKSSIRLPMLAQAGNDQEEGSAADIDASIVGLWHVVYTAGGSTFNETLDQWHSDGTEFENAWLPPDTGNICFGVWKVVASRTVRLHHVGWLFTPGSTPPTASGTFTLDETNVVSRDGQKYTGTFTFKTYDNTGAPTGIEVKGTIAATRITVD
jgi:hypothetical protein